MGAMFSSWFDVAQMFKAAFGFVFNDLVKLLPDVLSVAVVLFLVAYLVRFLLLK